MQTSPINGGPGNYWIDIGEIGDAALRVFLQRTHPDHPWRLVLAEGWGEDLMFDGKDVERIAEQLPGLLRAAVDRMQQESPPAS